MNRLHVYLKDPVISFTLSVMVFIAILGGGSVGLWLSRGDWVYPEQLQSNGDIALTSSIGQTILASQTGLQGVDIKITVLALENSIPLTLTVREKVGDTYNIRTSSAIVVDQFSRPQWIRFSFEPLFDSRLKSYYIALETPGSFENIRVASGPPDAYLDGSLYVGDQPQDKQLAFRLVYNRPFMLWDVVLDITSSVPKAVAVAIVFFLPGWALLALCQVTGGRRWITHWAEGISVAFGVSLAWYTLLFLWTDMFNLYPGSGHVWLSVAVSGLILVIVYRPWRRRLYGFEVAARSWAKSTQFWPDVALVSVAVLSGIGRFLMARGLFMPLWDDSVHHSVVVQRILENGGMFQNWMPYAPYQTFTFHFGFHTNTAIFAWAADLTAPTAVIWGGQFFNWLAVLALYPLAFRLKGNWAGITAVLIGGMFLQFPAYYTNWGRYPQMFGQTVLTIAIWWMWMTLTAGKLGRRDWVWLIIGGLLLAGTVLGYYRMGFHLLAFFAAVLMLFSASLITIKRWSIWMALAASGMAAGIMMITWLNYLSTRLNPAGGSSRNAAISLTFLEKINVISVDLTVSQALLLLAGSVAIVWGGKKIALPIVWFWILVVGLPILRASGLPITNLIQDFTTQSSLYIPLALMGGVTVGQLGRRWDRRSWWISGFMALVLISLAMWRLPSFSNRIDREFDLSSAPDLKAAEWIRTNLPEDAFFLINGIVYTDGYSAIAGDAGTWLPLLTGRGVTIPPQYALLVEEPIIPGYSQTVNTLVQQLSTRSPLTPEAAKRLICEFPIPITYAYLGQARGTVDKALIGSSRPMLPATALLYDPDFTLIYQRDRVLIFEFDRSVCVNMTSTNN